MAKMNVFISQPMKGKETGEIQWERDELVKDLKKYLGEDIKVLDTIFHFAEDVPSLVYLGRSLEVLAKADLAVFMDGRMLVGVVLNMMPQKITTFPHLN